jgi:hypothetical protein
MRTRVLVPLAAAAFVMVSGLWAPVRAGQAPSGTKTFDPTAINTDAAIKAATEAARAAAAAKNWKPGRTPWGDPDLQGYYLNLSYTPLERPRELAGKAFYTEPEAIAAFKKAVEADAEVDPRTVHYDWKEYGMDAWQSPIRPNLRTGLIVDTPDGRIPPMTPEAQKRGARPREGADVLARGLYERCVTGNQGPPRLPGNHDSESQIVQTPGYVVILMQSNNDVRIIPLDNRPHLPQRVGQWLGDARGHFEGNTLVIDTTNFGEGRDWRGSTSGMHLTERLTPTDPKTLKYEFTVNDPTIWTKPWSAEVPWPRIEPPLYEFACHEQNYGLMNIVKGTQLRAAEAAAKGGARPAARETPEGDR